MANASYKIKQIFPLLWVITFLIAVFVSVVILIRLSPAGSSWLISAAVFTPCFYAGYKALHYTAVAEIEITINNKEFQKSGSGNLYYKIGPTLKLSGQK